MNTNHLTKIISVDIELKGTIQKNKTASTPMILNITYWEGNNHVTTELTDIDQIHRILNKALHEVDNS